VAGLKCHLFLVMKGAEMITGRTPDPVLSLRLISLVYGVLSLLPFAFAVRAITGRGPPALLAAALLAFAPLHQTYSHIGTPDLPALFWFLLALFLAHRYARDRSPETWFLLAGAAGACLALKFTVPVLLPLALLLVTDRKPVRRAVEAALALCGAFALFSLFIYRPQDFLRFLHMLAYDNLHVAEAHSLGLHLKRYGLAVVPALGAPAALLGTAGAVLVLRGAPGRIRRRLAGRKTAERARILLADPLVVWTAPFLLYTVLSLRLGVHAVRHVLVPLVLLCAAGGIAAERLLRGTGARRRAGAALLAAAAVYLAGNAAAWEMWYLKDVRGEAARWLEENRRPGETASAFVRFSRVRGTTEVEGGEETTARPSTDWLVACDLEYGRYFRRDDPSEIYHPWGGRARFDFYRDLFAGRTPYREAKAFPARAWSPEQALILRGVFEHLGNTVPRRCVGFRRRE